MSHLYYARQLESRFGENDVHAFASEAARDEWVGDDPKRKAEDGRCANRMAVEDGIIRCHGCYPSEEDVEAFRTPMRGWHYGFALSEYSTFEWR